MSQLNVNELSREIQAAIDGLKTSANVEEVGVVTKVSDGIVWIYGLTGCGLNEMISLEAIDGSEVLAFALNLEEDQIGAVLLGEDRKIAAGGKARLTGRITEAEFINGQISVYAEMAGLEAPYNIMMRSLVKALES